MQKRRNIAGQYSDYASQIVGRHLFIFALTVSLIWHICCVFSVKLFVAAPVSDKSINSNVCFIGAILPEGPTTPPTKIKRDTSKELLYAANMFTGQAFSEDNTCARYIPNTDYKEVALKSDASGIAGVKQVPQKQFDKIDVSYKAYPSRVNGPARLRELIYKPDMPTSLRWDEELGVDLDRLGGSFEMELKFWVSPEGKVKMVERVSSSGHPTIDLVGIRYLKGWQFAPLLSGEAKTDQWGTVKLNFTLAKKEAK